MFPKESEEMTSTWYLMMLEVFNLAQSVIKLRKLLLIEVMHWIWVSVVWFWYH